MAERVLRLVANVDVRAFKLDPTDGYLLSRIDGRLGTRGLALETGLPEDVVERSLEKLETLGIAEPVDGPPRPRANVPAKAAPAAPAPAAPAPEPPKPPIALEPPPAREPPKAHPNDPPRARIAPEKATTRYPRVNTPPRTAPVASVFSRPTFRPAAPFGAPTPMPTSAPPPPPAAMPTPPPIVTTTEPFDVALGGPKYDARELDEEVDLTVEQKRKILDLYYRLDDLDHFTALGLTRDADKKAVKRAYFELAALLHPDRYFKKNLGTFKAKMEVVFDRVTDAHDTLADRDKRAIYEAQLAREPTTQGMEVLLERALEEARRTSSAPPHPAVSAIPPPPRVSSLPPERARSVMPAAPSSIPVQPPGPLSAEELQARRQALARKLLGSRPSAPPSAEGAIPASQRPAAGGVAGSYAPADAVEALKRRYTERAEGIAVAQARAHFERAERALEQGDIATASASFRAAAELSPNDPEALARAEQLRREAEEAILASAVQKADQEEKAGHHLQAARAWEKVAKIRVNDAYAHDKVARLYLKAEDVNLHDAAEHAKKAVQLEPRKVDFHVTLAEVYLRAGLKTSARKAAETGLLVAPDHGELRTLLKRTEKT